MRKVNAWQWAGVLVLSVLFWGAEAGKTQAAYVFPPHAEDRDDVARLVAVRVRDAVLRAAEHAFDAERRDDDAGLLEALAPQRVLGALARIDCAARELPSPLDVLDEQDPSVVVLDQRADGGHQK